MAKYIVDGEDLTGIADAIREKTGGSEQIVFPTGFTNGIGSLYGNYIQKSITLPISNRPISAQTISSVGNLTIPDKEESIIFDPYCTDDHVYFKRSSSGGNYIVYYHNYNSNPYTVSANSITVYYYEFQ